MSEVVIRKGEATRIRIIEVAYQLFIEQGYAATSMRQLIDAAGITMGGVYNHFANKEAIWEAVLMAKHPYHEILPLIQSAEGDTVAAFIQHAAAQLVSALGKRKDVLNLMFIELVEFDGKHIPDLFHAILPEFLHLAQIFAQKRGAVRPVPLPILARSFAGFFFAYYITELLLPPEVQELMGEDALASFVDVYLHGILDDARETPHV